MAFRGFDPGAVVVIAFPCPFVADFALAHLARRPRAFSLGRDLVDFSRLERDVQMCGVGRPCEEGEQGESKRFGVCRTDVHR